MLKPHLLLAGALCPLLVACGRLSGPESELVGTWDTYTIDATESMAFRSDHTFSTEDELGGHRFAVASGTWHVSDRHLTRRFTSAASDTLRHMIGQELSDRISQISSEKLILEHGITYERRK
jgi:hypothetical protein